MQIYLLAPQHADDSFDAAMATGLVSAVLIARADMDEAAYLERVAKLRPVAQANDVAVLLDDLPDAVRASGADGTHLTSGIKEFTAAAKALKPEYIAGAGDVRSRHEAMLRGEAGADYLMFGTLDAAPNTEEKDLAEWWNETFEIPGALADTVTPLADLVAPSCEFIVLGDNVWSHPDGAVAALRLADEKFGSDAP